VRRAAAAPARPALRRSGRVALLGADQRRRAHAGGLREMTGESPYHRPDGRELRSSRTRARIFDAAIEEFRRVGFEAACVAKVARAAGVSRPSFYFHFPTKDHILLELQWRLDTRITAAVAAIDDNTEALHTFVEQLVTIEEELGNSELFRDVLQMWARPP